MQSAYRCHHSTKTPLLRLENDILLDMNKQLVTILVMLDLSLVFDTIDHTVLLQWRQQIWIPWNCSRVVSIVPVKQIPTSSNWWCTFWQVWHHLRCSIRFLSRSILILYLRKWTFWYSQQTSTNSTLLRWWHSNVPCFLTRRSRNTRICCRCNGSLCKGCALMDDPR